MEDLVECIIAKTQNVAPGVEIYNVGVDSATSVNSIADFVCEALDLKSVEYKYTGGNVGWKGDVPSFSYDLSKIHADGWKARYSSDEAVKKTLKYVLNKDK